MGRKYQKRLTSQQDGGQFLGSGAGQFPHWAGKMGNVPSVPEFFEIGRHPQLALWAAFFRGYCWHTLGPYR